MADQSSEVQHRRLDKPHRQLPNPLMFDIPKKPVVRLLLMQLDDEDMELRRFARRLTMFSPAESLRGGDGQPQICSQGTLSR